MSNAHYHIAAGASRAALEALGRRIARRQRRNDNVRVAAKIIGLTSLLLGMLLAGWVLADGPARLLHDYNAACAAGADCGADE